MSQDVNVRLAQIEAQLRGIRSEMTSSLGAKVITRHHQELESSFSELAKSQEVLTGEVQRLTTALDAVEKSKIPKVVDSVTGLVRKITELTNDLIADVKTMKQAVQQLTADNKAMRETLHQFLQQRANGEGLAEQLRELRKKNTPDYDGSPNDVDSTISSLLKLLEDYLSACSPQHDVSSVAAATKTIR